MGERLARYVEAPKETEHELKLFIQNQPEFGIFDAKMLNLGSVYTRVTYETLVQWLLFVGQRAGVESALERLRKYLALDYNPSVEILALYGVEVQKAFDLTHDVSLVPFGDLPISPLKEMFDPPPILAAFGRAACAGKTNLGFSPQGPSAALIKKVELRPKSVLPDAKVVLHAQESKSLYEVCECLTLIGKATPLPVAHSFALEEWVPCAGHLSGGWTSPVHDVFNPSPFKLSDGYVLEAKAKCELFLQLKQEIRDKLRAPIQRLNQARRRQDSTDKAIDLGIAFEALLLGDRCHKEQIAFTFRLRGAWFLGRCAEERLRLVEVFSKIYDRRSIAVHTGKLDSKVKLPHRGNVETQVFLEEADDLCVRAILKIIEDKGFPNWNKIILG